MRARDINGIRTKIRSIARLVLELEHETGLTGSRISDFLSPEHYDEVARCVKRLGEKRSPQLALALGHYVKQVNLLKIAEAIKQSKNKALADAENFARSYEASWCNTVASATSRTQRLRKMQKSIELPTAGDITLLSSFIQKETKEATHNADLERLVKLVLSGLLLFNKRRPMEVDEINLRRLSAGC